MSFSSFGFTNKDVSDKTIAPNDLKLVGSYARVEDEADVCVLSNKTAPLDQGELITFRANTLDKVSTSQTVQYPTAVRNGVQYVIKAEEILRTVDDSGNIVSDEPVVAYLTIRHQCSTHITADLVNQVVLRVLGACYKEDGTNRFDDLMRSALVPVEN
jgi:hypothetical protein